MYSKILVPVDGSLLAEAVLPHAVALAKLSGAEIVLLRVAVNPVAEFALSDPAMTVSFIQEIESEQRAYMDRLISNLRESGQDATTLVREGPVAETILSVASEVGADVIIMSTHGISGVQRWLLGSTADRVVTHSPIPVMLIRAKE